MTGIINGFNMIITFIQSAWQLISNIFKGIATAFLYIQKIETVLIGLIGQMPEWISGFMFVTLIISIIYFIIGRVGGTNA